MSTKKIKSNNKELPELSRNFIINEALIKEFDEKSIALLAQRLEEDDYPTPFDGLNDWHMLRALAIHRPELTLSYHHLIDQEPFDED